MDIDYNVYQEGYYNLDLIFAEFEPIEKMLEEKGMMEKVRFIARHGYSEDKSFIQLLIEGEGIDPIQVFEAKGRMMDIISCLVDTDMDFSEVKGMTTFGDINIRQGGMHFALQIIANNVMVIKREDPIDNYDNLKILTGNMHGLNVISLSEKMDDHIMTIQLADENKCGQIRLDGLTPHIVSVIIKSNFSGDKKITVENMRYLACDGLDVSPDSIVLSDRYDGVKKELQKIVDKEVKRFLRETKRGK